MQNDAGIVNRTLTKIPCTLADVEYWSDFTTMYAIDEDGEPVEVVDDTSGDFRCYHCNSCENEFDDFNKVKEHLND